MTSRPPTTLARSARLSNKRMSYPQEENEVGLFPLQEYSDYKKVVYSTSKIEDLDTEYTYTKTDVERPQTAHSKASEYVVNRMNSRDDLVQK
jgi:hypothetical protein